MKTVVIGLGSRRGTYSLRLTFRGLPFAAQIAIQPHFVGVDLRVAATECLDGNVATHELPDLSCLPACQRLITGTHTVHFRMTDGRIVAGGADPGNIVTAIDERF